LQERFDALLAELGLLPRRAFTLAQLLDRIAATRGRPIELVPFSVNDPDAPSGAWVPYPDVDLIFHKATTPPHRAHIVLHETGHMLCGHTARSDALPLFLAQYSPAGHDPRRLVEQFGLLRSSWPTEQEREAEAFARHVGPWVCQKHRATGKVGSAAADAFTRVLDALGGPQG